MISWIPIKRVVFATANVAARLIGVKAVEDAVRRKKRNPVHMLEVPVLLSLWTPSHHQRKKARIGSCVLAHDPEV